MLVVLMAVEVKLVVWRLDVFRLVAYEEAWERTGCWWSWVEAQCWTDSWLGPLAPISHVSTQATILI